MSEFQINVDVAKTINSVKRAFPETFDAVDAALSSIIGLIGFTPNYLNEYAKYALTKTKIRLTEKLSKLPTSKIQRPPAYLAGSALQACCFSADCDELHNMFANLLATAMNIDTQHMVHPAFVELIKNLSPIEASIISSTHFQKEIFPMCSLYIEKQASDADDFFSVKELGPNFKYSTSGSAIIKNIVLYSSPLLNDLSDFKKLSSITENLNRLRIMELDSNSWHGYYKEYQRFVTLSHEFIHNAKKEIPDGFSLIFKPEKAILTSFGQDFLQACVL